MVGIWRKKNVVFNPKIAVDPKIDMFVPTKNVFYLFGAIGMGGWNCSPLATDIPAIDTFAHRI